MALKVIAEHERPTPAVVARSIQLTPSTTTTVLDRLENGGLIQRKRTPEDRRSVLLVLTKAGLVRVEKLPPPLQERFLGRLGALPQEEQDGLLAALEHIVELMDADDPEAAPLLAAEPVKNR